MINILKEALIIKIEKSSMATKLIIGNIIGYIFMVIMNILANILPLGGRTTKEIAKKFDNIFIPAGFTFAIWGVIYLLLFILLISLVKGLLQKRERSIKVIFKLSWYFLFSCLLNGSWIFTWHYEQIFISLLLMIGLLGTLIKIYINLKKLPFYSKVYLAPFSIYLGWVTVATVANVVVFSVALEWGRLGLPEEFWFTLLVLVTLGITVLFVLRKKDIFYGLTILWSITGIFVKRLTAQPGWSYSAYVALSSLIIVILILFQEIRR